MHRLASSYIKYMHIDTHREMRQKTHTCKGLKMWNYVSIISLGVDKILLYLNLAHIMYIFSNFALCKVPYILYFKLLS